ncbi:hypothetical protein QLQ12_25600 [Actinoplanes sp. NEAU-A12]|uniref:Uncharacterized protein n=1 Tax=Actinoplanes sandaracinus TaxID=3045177 RepID=A0ABT6WQN6_9ACTN|nr:hypothetical protein [Actinoplanes sandaracinus]MDI6101999.1 hypothetical protein [Actinoplanes sandaracinus]
MTEGLTGGAGQDWQATLRERTERATRRRTRRAGMRQEAARRRAHGLIDRHAARLARARAAPRTTPATPAGCGRFQAIPATPSR